MLPVERFNAQASHIHGRRESYRNLALETPGHNRRAYTVTIPAIEALVGPQVEIYGTLPKKKKGIVAMLHADAKDLWLAQWLPVAIAGRTMRTLAKRTIVEPRVNESEGSQKGRTQHNIFSSKSGLGLFVQEQFGKYVKNFDVIPVEIDNPRSRVNVAAMRTVQQELAAEHLVGIFPQGHRKPEFDLLDMMEGLAVMIQRSPDAPVYPVGMSGTDKFFGHKITIGIGDPFTYHDIERAYRRKPTKQEILEFVADRIGEQTVDPDLIPAWRLQRYGGFTRQQIEGLKERYGGSLRFAASVLLEDDNSVVPEHLKHIITSPFGQLMYRALLEREDGGTIRLATDQYPYVTVADAAGKAPDGDDLPPDKFSFLTRQAQKVIDFCGRLGYEPTYEEMVQGVAEYGVAKALEWKKEMKGRLWYQRDYETAVSTMNGAMVDLGVQTVKHIGLRVAVMPTKDNLKDEMIMRPGRREDTRAVFEAFTKLYEQHAA